MGNVDNVAYNSTFAYSVYGTFDMNRPSLLISRRSVETFQRYGDCSIFQDGGRCHLGFWKFQIFNSWDGQEGRTASARQILSKSLKPRLRYGDFSTWRPSAILDFQKWEIWISFTRVGTTHEEYLMVFVTVQNLVVISALISIVCKF